MVIDTNGKVEEMTKIDVSLEGLMKAAITMIQDGMNNHNVKLVNSGISLIRATTSLTNSQLKVAEFGTKYPGVAIPILGPQQSQPVTRQ